MQGEKEQRNYTSSMCVGKKNELQSNDSKESSTGNTEVALSHDITLGVKDAGSAGIEGRGKEKEGGGTVRRLPRKKKGKGNNQTREAHFETWGKKKCRLVTIWESSIVHAHDQSYTAFKSRRKKPRLGVRKRNSGKGERLDPT